MNLLFGLAIVLLCAGAALLLLAARAGTQVEAEPSAVANADRASANSAVGKAELGSLRPVGWRERLAERCQKLGLTTSPVFWTAVISVFVAGEYVIAYRVGSVGSGLYGVVLVACIVFCGQWRKGAIRRRILLQLPGLVEQINRRVKVGMSLSQAVGRSVSVLENPLRDIVERAIRRESLGTDLDASFAKEARVTGVKEFQLLGAVFRVNRQFGGSVSQSLDNLIELLYQNERSQRELKAMTGETRITAWVMGVTPSVMAMYLLVTDPQGIQTMWLDPEGRQALFFALGAQAVGALVLWRMLRSLS